MQMSSRSELHVISGAELQIFYNKQAEPNPPRKNSREGEIETTEVKNQKARSKTARQGWVGQIIKGMCKETKGMSKETS